MDRLPDEIVCRLFADQNFETKRSTLPLVCKRWVSGGSGVGLYAVAAGVGYGWYNGRKGEGGGNQEDFEVEI